MANITEQERILRRIEKNKKSIAEAASKEMVHMFNIIKGIAKDPTQTASTRRQSAEFIIKEATKYHEELRGLESQENKTKEETSKAEGYEDFSKPLVEESHTSH